MMWRDVGVTLILSLILPVVAQGARHTPPGKPKLTSCRSPDKETFTCWWEAGSDGGRPTTYSLFYHKENSETVYECPDYHTAGANSCFFNKNETSIWVNYNITVVATNALGNNFSDPVDVDVVYIVQPHTPENVTVGVLEDEDGPFLRVSWEPPRKADTRSGWITLIYELRVKLEEAEEWEEHRAGQQKMFNIFSLHSGGVYMVQVRCKPDHGFWSEWSTASYVKVPDYIPRERSMWILIAVFSAFIFLILTWIITLNRSSVKHCLLPPVPGPKIKGFDQQLLKKGKPEEVFNSLVVQSFPPRSTDYEDLLVEYLEVYVNEKQELMPEGKDLRDVGCLKSKSQSDNDSGRGSCDSHTLLMEKCGGVESKDESSYEEPELLQGQAGSWERLERGDSQVVDTPDSSDARVKTWPLVFSPSIHGSSDNHHYGTLEMPKQHSTSEITYSVPDHLFPTSTSFPHHHHPEYRDSLGEYSEYRHSRSPSTGVLYHWEAQHHPQAHSNFNIRNLERQKEATGLGLPPSRSMEYVEVQKVNQENQLVLKPLSSHGRGPSQVQFGRAVVDYSKVNGVNNDNVLLLQRQREMAEAGQYCDYREKEGAEAERYPTQQQGKTTKDGPVATQLQESTCLTTSGYVDTVPTMPTF
ncbi:prolactin receptor a isoform X1 [Oncorhynchus mykiss]|uniref:Prolactin receptor n=1 Tax=Oncorhynchus mykiss TaxID=8022 RepID=A0A8C7QET2_ONCMY|nr:prolactin receptor a isoform X1 [Oncorhynchus mykiss]XP_036792581.1 prolactin receptor a isoform X1 [Oncorhynchus mykiss]XP_036792582.1 prolactin receptor a isoform X1 [Oncorhynchus mykiss]XP_036792583.1 prolactin receptor a isoform X1 [Oncorhynchus mykiss]